MTYLLDSDIVIDAMRRRRGIRTWIEEHLAAGVSISIISVAEISEGAFQSVDPVLEIESTRRFLGTFAILGISEPTAETFGAIRADLRRTGNLIPDFDLMIAATAIHHNLRLVTRNVRHYGRIAGLQLESPA